MAAGADSLILSLMAMRPRGFSLRTTTTTVQPSSCILDVYKRQSLDTFPVWEPGNARSLVYQTCGIARHAHTHEWAGLGPATLHRLNLDSGDMETVAEDGRYDYLCPSFSPE